VNWLGSTAILFSSAVLSGILVSAGLWQLARSETPGGSETAAGPARVAVTRWLPNALYVWILLTAVFAGPDALFEAFFELLNLVPR
jgi:hypothetical protein